MDNKKKTIDLGYTDEYSSLGCCSEKSTKKIKEKVYPTLWLRFKGQDKNQKEFSKLDLKTPIKMLIEGELTSKSANTSERNGKKEENENYDIKIFKATIQD